MILGIILAAIASFLISEAVGYGVHRLAHNPKSGKLYRDHLHHHFQAYPPGQYLSEKYIGDLKTSFLPWFVPVFLLLNGLAMAVLPWQIFLVFLAVSSTVSLVNNYLHDSFHVRGHWLKRFAWHQDLSEIHEVHHHNVKRNLGIYWYGVDRLLGTFKRSSSRVPGAPSPSSSASPPELPADPAWVPERPPWPPASED